MELGPIVRGWRIEAGDEEGWQSEAHFDPPSIDQAVRTFFTEGAGD
jgi:hypothetical protein